MGHGRNIQIVAEKNYFYFKSFWGLLKSCGVLRYGVSNLSLKKDTAGPVFEGQLEIAK